MGKKLTRLNGAEWEKKVKALLTDNLTKKIPAAVN